MLALYLAMLETPADQQKFLRFYEANERLICAVALRVLKNPSPPPLRPPASPASPSPRPPSPASARRR